MGTAPTIALYRGHTHGEIALMPNAPVGTQIGEWYRDVLAEKEYIPEGWRWDPIRQMRTFNHAHWEFKRIFCSYDRKTNRLHVPIAFCDQAKQVLENFGCEVKEIPLPSYPLRKIDVKMNPKFTDRPAQIEPIKRCSDPTPGIKPCSLQTGVGKTYSAVKAAVNLGYATLIIVPGLVEQWIDDIDEYTTAKKGNEIYKIEGFQTFAFLAKNPTYMPSFFVASTRTMQMFANQDEGYDVLPWTYTKFFETYGIGTKIIDECHKQFHANTMMDLKTNVPHNIYLSATFDQTSKCLRKIFDRIFPKDTLIGGDNYDKYVTVQFYNFYGEIDEWKCVKAKGYMHMKYETELLKSKHKFEYHMTSIIDPLLNQYYINKYEKGHKCLVFCSTIEFVEAVTKHLRALYPQLKVNPYIGGSSRSILAESDLVVSTIGKASTGLDWKGLHCCLNTVSVRSPVLTSQMLGRLRKINGEQLVYIDLCDNNLRSQCRHAVDRKRDLRRMAAKFDEFNGVLNAVPVYDPITAHANTSWS